MPPFENNPHVTEGSFHPSVAFFSYTAIIMFAWISQGSCSITLPMRTVLVHEGSVQGELVGGRLRGCNS